LRAPFGRSLFTGTCGAGLTSLGESAVIAVFRRTRFFQRLSVRRRPPSLRWHSAALLPSWHLVRRRCSYDQSTDAPFRPLSAPARCFHRSAFPLWRELFFFLHLFFTRPSSPRDAYVWLPSALTQSVRVYVSGRSTAFPCHRFVPFPLASATSRDIFAPPQRHPLLPNSSWDPTHALLSAWFVRLFSFGIPASYVRTLLSYAVQSFRRPLSPPLSLGLSMFSPLVCGATDDLSLLSCPLPPLSSIAPYSRAFVIEPL